MNTAPFRDLCNIPDSGNDKKWDYHEQMAKYQMDDSEISQKKEMTRLLMNAIDDYNAGKVAPDTIGADYFFLDQFMTYEMEYDFVAIEMDFLEPVSYTHLFPPLLVHGCWPPVWSGSA